MDPTQTAVEAAKVVASDIVSQNRWELALIVSVAAIVALALHYYHTRRLHLTANKFQLAQQTQADESERRLKAIAEKSNQRLIDAIVKLAERQEEAAIKQEQAFMKVGERIEQAFKEVSVQQMNVMREMSKKLDQSLGEHREFLVEYRTDAKRLRETLGGVTGMLSAMKDVLQAVSARLDGKLNRKYSLRLVENSVTKTFQYHATLIAISAFTRYDGNLDAARETTVASLKMAFEEIRQILAEMPLDSAVEDYHLLSPEKTPFRYELCSVVWTALERFFAEGHMQTAPAAFAATIDRLKIHVSNAIETYIRDRDPLDSPADRTAHP